MIDMDRVMLGPQVLELVDQIFRHLFGSEDVTNKMANSLGRTTEIHASSDFLRSLSTPEMLLLIEQMLNDSRFDRMRYDNWNYFGDFVKKWPDRLIKALKLKGITYNSEKPARKNSTGVYMRRED